MIADGEVLAVLARTRGPGPVPFVAGVLSWPGFTADERSWAWDRFAGAVLYGTPAEMARARDYLMTGRAS